MLAGMKRCHPPRTLVSCKSAHIQPVACQYRSKAAKQQHPPVRADLLEGQAAPDQTRRELLLNAAAALAVACTAQASAARAETLTLQDVTPSIAPAGPLGPVQQSVISIFEAATPAVVTVFDTTLIVSATCPTLSRPCQRVSCGWECAIRDTLFIAGYTSSMSGQKGWDGSMRLSR